MADIVRACSVCDKPVTNHEARVIDGRACSHLACYTATLKARFLADLAREAKEKEAAAQAARDASERKNAEGLARCPRCAKRMYDGSCDIPRRTLEVFAAVPQAPGLAHCKPCRDEEIRVRNLTRNAPSVAPPGSPLAPPPTAPAAPAPAPAMDRFSLLDLD